MKTETYLSEASPTRDEKLRTLAAKHRRIVLDRLADSNRDEVCLQQFVDDIIERCPGNGRPVLRRQKQRRINLVHTHLPKLDGYSIVDWDATNTVVAVGPEFEAVVAMLRKILAFDATEDRC